MRSEVLVSVNVSITVFRLSRLINISVDYQRLGGTYCLTLQGAVNLYVAIFQNNLSQ